ncbi:MAG: hypothetical protein KatS3mg060_1650 [Dehalococcoidia bacterium]|nr:MAG: hypothetical protein KatS3mg060_1650 [Dehalococcoidia bacterium]
MGAVLVLVVRRWPAAVRLLWLLSALAALALALPVWPAADVRIPWVPGTPDVALPLSLHVDALTVTLAGSVGLIAVATALGDLSASAPWRFVIGRQLAFGIALVVVAAADVAIAASAVLLLPLAAGLSRRFDDDARLSAIGGLFAAGLSLLAAAGFGVGSLPGFLALAAAILFVLFQLPFTSLGESVLTGLPGAFATNLATIVLPGMAIVIRFGVEGGEPWRLQLLSAVGASTMAFAGVVAARNRSLPSLLAAVTSLQAGACLVALGQGISPTQPAAILIGTSAVLALAALSLTADRLATVLGTNTIDGLVGVGRAAPITTMLLLAAALALSPLPLVGGAAIGGAVSLAGAISDGRIAIVLVALLGLGGAAAGLGRMAVLPFLPNPDRPSLREQPLALLAAAAPLLAAVIAGALAFTAWDPAARAAIAAFGTRPRPTGGELIALPWIGVVGALLLLVLTSAAGIFVGVRRGRTQRLPIRRAEPGQALVPADEAEFADWMDENERLLLDTRPVLGWLGGIGRFVLWAFAQGLAVLEGRYYMATVLVLGLWALIVFLG